jgi:hypothetical protein
MLSAAFLSLPCPREGCGEWYPPSRFLLALGQCIMHMVRCGPRYAFCACSPLQDLGLCPPTVITFGEHLWVGTSGSLSGTVSRPHYPNYNTSHVCFSMNGNGVDLSRLNKLSIHLHGCKWRVYETGVSGLGHVSPSPGWTSAMHPLRHALATGCFELVRFASLRACAFVCFGKCCKESSSESNKANNPFHHVSHYTSNCNTKICDPAASPTVVLLPAVTLLHSDGV